MEQETLYTITRIQQAFGIPVGDTPTNEAFEALMGRLRDIGKSTDEVNFDAMMEILQQMEDELQFGLPRYELLAELNVELHSIMGTRLRMAAADISKFGATSALGLGTEAQTARMKARADRINALVAKKVAQIYALAEFISVANKAGGAQPPTPPIDNSKSGGDDDGMLKRVEKLETDVAAIKTDVAVIKANGATKSDVAELRGLFGELKAATKGDIADAKFQIILWVVSAIVIAQLLPIIVKLIPGVASLLM